MQNILLTIDKISTWVGQLFAWLIFSLTLMISWEVFSRYVLNNPHPWAFDVMSMMYGTLFMMAGAYTLSKNGHVRGDVLYGFFPPRLQAGLDLLLYLVFFIPGVVAMAWAGYHYVSTPMSLPMGLRSTHLKLSFPLQAAYFYFKVWWKLCAVSFASKKVSGPHESRT
jgi:TRAP-type mannitol/chloroaromatic compound transport system permease small subunit